MNEEPEFLDDISDSAKGFLARFAKLVERQKLVSPMPGALFKGFEARGWVSGTPSAATLTRKGITAAYRICGNDGVKDAFKRKPFKRGVQPKML